MAASAAYSAGGTATTLSSGTTVSDPESTNLVSGTVSIASGFLTGDTLATTTTGTSITASYNASTGVLSLSGSDTLGHYQQVLDSVTYASSSQNPTNSGADPSRTISWLVNDGTLNSATQTTTVGITGSSPALGNVAASAAYSAGGTATTLSSGTTVSDPESTNLVSGTVSIASGFLTGDTLATTTTGTSITASYNASTGVLSLSGSDTLGHYQQVLDSVTYASSSQNPTNSGADPSRTISWLVNDGTLNSATQTTTVTISTPPAPPSITSAALSSGLWKLTGSAGASSTVTVFDGATKLGTTTANSSGSWSFTTTENNSAIRDFLATVTDAAGNTSATSAAWFEGTASNDVFSFPSEAALVAPTAVFGNGGSDTVAITAPATLVDADFAHAHNILTLLLTGASAVTLGARAAAVGVANVSTGNGATSITDSNTGTLNVNAGALAAAALLTLSGSEKFAVTGLQGNLVATNETGALNVTTAAALALSIATGGGTDTINASAMTQGETLTLTGSHAATVTVGGNLVAGAYTGKLTVTASGTAPQAITTGTAADSITAAHGADTVTAGAGADTINVSGHTLADSFVYQTVARQSQHIVRP